MQKVGTAHKLRGGGVSFSLMYTNPVSVNFHVLSQDIRGHNWKAFPHVAGGYLPKVCPIPGKPTKEDPFQSENSEK